jgi:hypothetical protein
MRTGYGLMEDRIVRETAKAVSSVPVKMVYHYLSSAVPVKEQVDRHLGICKLLPYPVDFHWVDFEHYYNEMGLDFARECVQFISRVNNHYGAQKCGIYTNRWLHDGYYSKVSGGQDPLWFSWPIDEWQGDIEAFARGSVTTPLLPDGRSGADWLFWQFSYKGDGVEWGAGRSYAFDLNVFNGTRAELLRRFNKDQGDDPPETLTCPVCEAEFICNH